MSGEEPIVKPSISTNVIDELRPHDPSIWVPNSFMEWEESERVRAYLVAWTRQMDQERGLRSLYALLIFGLICFEVLSGFALLLLIGTGVLKLDVDLLKVVFSGLMVQVFGLGFLVAKYLFSKPLQHSIERLGKK